jgi:hypothetical protein
MEGKRMEKAEIQTKEERDKDFREVLGGAMIPVQVELFEPFVKFGKEYLQFFGSKDNFETFCMKLIYHEINRLHSDLRKYVEDNEKKGHILDGQEWFKKHPHLACTEPEDEDC